MTLSWETIQSLTVGALHTERTEKGITFSKYTPSQLSV